MTELFLKIINMSISASWLVLAVLALRLFLKKAPKWSVVTLWGIVAARLLFPFSIESALSLIPSAETVTPAIMTDTAPTIDSGIPIINNTLNPIISETFEPAPFNSANPLQVLIPLFAVAWLFGIFLLLVYTLISYLRLRSKVSTAVRLRDNIYQSEHINSPFVLGLIKPKIYLPFSINGGDSELVIAHEQSHIRRRDHLWKPLGFLLLTVYWLNPLMWLAYILLCRDIELACDERVIREFGNEQRADYSAVLLACSVDRRSIAACPLAFGEVGVKERVKTVLNYKKPAFWLVMVSVVICIIVGVCFLTDPVSAPVDKPETPAPPVADEEPSNAVQTEKPVNNTETSWPELAEMESWRPLEELFENYTVEQATADGCVVLDENTPLSDDEDIWYDFYNKTCEGYTAAVRVYQKYNDPSYYIVKEIAYNGEKYLLRYYDRTSDAGKWFLYQSEYQYLVMSPYSWRDIHSVNFLLADSKEVTYQGYISRMMSSAFPPEDDIYGNCHLIYSVYYDNEIYESVDKFYGTALADIDEDGVEEECWLGMGSTSGVFSFKLSIFENGDYEYYNVFIPIEYHDISFARGEDGKLQIQAVTRGDESETHLYDIVITDEGNVELTENGEALASATNNWNQE